MNVRRSPVRFLLFSGLVVLVLFAARSAFSTTPEGSVRAAVRDYLAIQRVEKHADVLKLAAAESGVDPYLLAGIMVAESSGRVGAKSKRGALGLFQLMPVTANWRADILGLPEPTEKELLNDAELNARLGANNVAWLLDTYDGNVRRSLVAYNLGTGRLAKYCREAGGWEAWVKVREEAGDSDLLAYADRVMRYRNGFRERALLED